MGSRAIASSLVGKRRKRLVWVGAECQSLARPAAMVGTSANATTCWNVCVGSKRNDGQAEAETS